MRSPVVLLLLLVGALGLTAFLFLREPEAGEAAQAPAQGPELTDDASATATPSAASEPAQAIPDAARANGQARTPLSESGARVTLEWVVQGGARRGYDAPEPGAHIVAKLFDGMQAGETASAEEVLVCDAKGRFRWPLETPEGPVTVTVEAVRAEPGAEKTFTSYGDSASVIAGGAAPRNLEVTFYPLDIHIVGTVTDEQGEALPGASVRGSAESTTTDADGGYRLPSSSARRQEYLYAQADGFAQERAIATTKGVSGEVHVDFQLGQSVQARGRVLDENGIPVQDARIATFFTNENVALSAADGSFVLDHLDPLRDRFSVYARKDGYVEASLLASPDELRAQELELVLTRGASVEGRVLDPDGAPLPGVELFIGFSSFAYNRLDATSGDDGAFVFPHVGAGSQTLVAQYPGFAPVTHVVEIPEDAAQLPFMTIQLERGHYLAGVVTDGDFQPLEGIWVSAQENGEYINARTETDAAGRFRIEGLPERGVALEFYDSEFVRKELPVAELDRDDLAVVLTRAGQVGGLVVDAASNAPLEEFLVRFVPPKLEEGDGRVGGYAAVWVREGKRFSGTAGIWDSGQEELEPGKFIGVEIRAKGYAPTTDPHVIVESELDPAGRVFRMLRGGTVAGRVFDPDGAPVAACDVLLRPADARYPGHFEAQYEAGITQTDEHGFFRLEDAPPGERVLWVKAPERSAVRDGPFDVPVGGSVERSIVLPDGGRIKGLVLAPDGSPEADVKVLVMATDVPGGTNFSKETSTAADGSFAFDELAAGVYQVSRLLEHGDERIYELSRACRLEAAGTTSVTLQATGSGTIRGRFELVDGKLPARLRVSVLYASDLAGHLPDDERPEDRPPTRGTFAEDGAFEVTGLGPGRYSVSALHFTQDGFLTGSAEVELAEGASEEVVVTLNKRQR